MFNGHDLLNLTLKQEFVGAHKAGFYGVHHHGCRVVHTQLSHDVLAVGGHGVRTQETVSYTHLTLPTIGYV